MVSETSGSRPFPERMGRVRLGVTAAALSLGALVLADPGGIQDSANSAYDALRQYHDRGVEFGTPTIDYGQQLLHVDNVRLSAQDSLLSDPSHTSVFNSKLLQPQVAYSVTHAGFMENQLLEAERYLVEAGVVEQQYRSESRWLDYYGNIASNHGSEVITYTAAMQDLIQWLGRTGQPVLFSIEEDVATRSYKQTIPIDLMPPDNSFIALTEPAKGELEETLTMVTTMQGDDKVEIPQEVELYFEWLRKQGVTEIHVAGEFAYNSDNRPACLGQTVLMYLDAGFRVRGIEGAVFPPAPPTGYEPESDLARVVEAVYSNQANVTMHNTNPAYTQVNVPHDPLDLRHELTGVYEDGTGIAHSFDDGHGHNQIGRFVLPPLQTAQ